MELSLDEIIKKKKIGSGGAKKFVPKKEPLRKTLGKPAFKETSRNIVDARQKIIQKNRSRIRDAREKLLSVVPKIRGDARRLIENRKSGGSGSIRVSSIRNGHSIQPSYRNGRTPYPQTAKSKLGAPFRRANVIDLTKRSRLPDLIEVPRGYVDYDNMAHIEEEEYAAARGLSRTVHNDITSRMDTYSSPPPSPPSASIRRLNSSESHFDPFDVYEVGHTRERRERQMSLEMSPPPPPPPPKGILRTSSRQLSPELYQRRYVSDNSTHLSYEMRSRLENAPDPHVSMGIFSNPSRSSSSNSMQHSPNGYRIVVSNLHPSVTQSDIKELFEDVGDLYEYRIVRPGVAEVIYKSLQDAEKAVDTYHNRQLDGQPMKCLLVNPRASDKPTAPAIKSCKSRLGTGKTPLEIDIDALHKVLFRRH